MSNISVSAPQVDGSLMPYIDIGDSCFKAVQLITGDDLRPPPRNIQINVVTESGKKVRLVIPYSESDTAVVYIDDVRV